MKDEVVKLVINIFERIHPLSENLKEKIFEGSDVIHIKKKDVLLNIGETSKYIYFIYNGSLRSYYLDQEGKDNTSWFLFENELAISVYSFFTQKPSFEAVETLEDCVLLRLSFKKLQQLYLEFPEFNYIGRILTEQYYIRSEEKANSLRMLSAKERYQQLIERYPEIIKRASLGYIASYLGITQHTLSRIRSKV
ncbi:Crp/Fnr family transcriptional regulator [Sphingobacterium bovistauri]|uniref:Crp/Fnr family transcriptional regulator n=1 Tax=Sphingobacterium bovistauri TaxID=2781959 RepID=A0ABS7Z6J7_9SPHI|nr:Crp/Fnr family transcriptional regulator [Sphingobacterium bovistauri]MCA5004554.1 Crp/Fnr family transcriptional regulator [Sphingobacterium bovistauri]